MYPAMKNSANGPAAYSMVNIFPFQETSHRHLCVFRLRLVLFSSVVVLNFLTCPQNASGEPHLLLSSAGTLCVGASCYLQV